MLRFAQHDIVLPVTIGSVTLKWPCHPERSEGSLPRPGEMLRCAQHDMSSGCLSISTSLSDLTQSRKACVPGFNGQAETCPSVRVDSFSM